MSSENGTGTITGVATAEPVQETAKGMGFGRVFSKEGVLPEDQFEWSNEVAEITGDTGKVVFRQEGCEFPKGWSQTAINIVASKYFYGDVIAGNGSPKNEQREYSVKQLVSRVADTIAEWGWRDGYFASADDAAAFRDELKVLCYGQYGAFNSPVWFNCGLFHKYGVKGNTTAWRWNRILDKVVELEPGEAYKFPQCSACFIQGIEDDMDSIMDLVKAEAMLFKMGSGTGTDLSRLRSTREKLSGGGKPSGPVSFFKVYDTVASIVKSGGKTRRAARMQTLLCSHPDILEFISCKVKEDRKARALIAAGYSAKISGADEEAYSSVAFQNTNISIRLTDDFMFRASGDYSDSTYSTRSVTTGEPIERLSAVDVLREIATGTHECGDPGVQYHDTIQAWHTCPNTAPINSSNPCSEYMFIDDSACNLASINLLKFMKDDGNFDVDRFKAAVRVFLLAQEILVSNSGYPTAKIAENSQRFRPLGLGYANLGALLMTLGIPYASEQGRTLAAKLTALLHGEAYATSAEIAAVVGAFDGFAMNKEPMLAVIKKHYDAAMNLIPLQKKLAGLDQAIWATWQHCLFLGNQRGFRNSQVTVLAPTGTIGFMMDCDTTGVEPDIALTKYKQLAGGGMLKLVNQSVPLALRRLGYSEDQICEIVQHLHEHGTIEDYPALRKQDLAVFDCSFPAIEGGRSISWRGHVEMMAAVQPFLSGAISKTVNMPNDATIEEIEDAYTLAWRRGVKALAIYRDGSKGAQPLNTKKDQKTEPVVAIAAPAVEMVVVHEPHRERLPATRRSLTHKFDIQGHKGYITTGLYPDGRPGELFVTMAKEGSTLSGLMDGIGAAVSIGLQYGVPLDVYVNKFAHTRFEPSGFTKNSDIPIAKSLMDYIFRWLGIEFLAGYRDLNTPNRPEASHAITVAAPAAEAAVVPIDTGAQTGPGLGDRDRQFAGFQTDAPSCDNCGSLTVRNGSCYRCFNCGNSLGCS